MTATPNSNLWLLPSGRLICLDDLATADTHTETADGNRERICLHIGYKQGGHVYIYDADVAYVYRLLEKGAHDVEA